MRYRWKLLLLLMAIALVPIVFGRTFGVRAVRKMGSELVEKTRQRVEAHAEERQRSLAYGYSRVLDAERRRLALALDQLGRSAREILSQPTSSDHTPYLAGDGQPAVLPDAAVSRHYQRSGSIQFQHELTVSRTTPVLKLAPGVTAGSVAADIARLPALQPEYRRLYATLSQQILWMGIYLENGVSSTFPGASLIPRKYDHRRQSWYKEALDGDASAWSQRFIDPITRRHVVALTNPLEDENGNPVGVAAFTVSMEQSLGQDSLNINLPPHTVSIVCGVEQTGKTGGKGVRIFLRSDSGQQNAHRWQRQIETEWLSSNDAALFAAMIHDIENKKAGSSRMGWKGQDSLWTYSPMGELDSVLMLIIPYREIYRPVTAAESHIQETTDELIANTGLAGGIMMLAVLLMAMWFSRTVTRPLSTLLEGTKRLAGGYFDTRVHIRSRDEFSELGHVFNQIGPRLKEHDEMRQALTLAREVQDTLFPEETLSIENADIAGKSISCDETGGDYYDFIHPPDNPSRVMVIVGDVSGHGIPATLLMTTVRASLRQSILHTGKPAAIVTAANRQLAQDVESSGRFMTLFLCELDPLQRSLRWVRAGHEPAVLYRPSQDHIRELGGKGVALGVWEDAVFTDAATEIETGDIIAIGTDGIWECRGPDGSMFGKEAFHGLIQHHADRTAAAIRDEVIKAVEHHIGDTVRDDDITLVVIKVL